MFVSSVREGSNCFLLPVDIKFSQHHHEKTAFPSSNGLSTVLLHLFLSTLYTVVPSQCGLGAGFPRLILCPSEVERCLQRQTGSAKLRASPQSVCLLQAESSCSLPESLSLLFSSGTWSPGPNPDKLWELNSRNAHCCCSVAQLCPTLCDPMDCSSLGLPVHHQLPELSQTHVHRVGDTIQPSHPLSPPSLAFNLSQQQGLFQWTGSLHQVAKVLELQHQH